MFENYVYTELVKAGFTPKYWRTKSKLEIDFVIEKENEILPIEVKLNQPKSTEKGLKAFIREHKPKRAFIISNVWHEETVREQTCAVRFTGIQGMLEELRKP